MSALTTRNIGLGCVFVFTVALIVASSLKGPIGAEGMALGLAISAFNLCALWGVIRLMGRASESNPRPTFGTVLVVLAFFVKLPVFVLGLTYARSLGEGALTCFLLGVALVYSALILWALARR